MGLATLHVFANGKSCETHDDASNRIMQAADFMLNALYDLDNGNMKMVVMAVVWPTQVVAEGGRF